MFGTQETRLVVLRGNSASGKSSLAEALRDRSGTGLAVISQDLIRRVVFHERDVSGAPAGSMILLMARHALENDFDVVVEGILSSAKYGPMLSELAAGHAGRTSFFYTDVSFEETVRRHQTRDKAAEFGEAELRSWYRERDLLPDGVEELIGPESSLEASADLVFARAGLRVREGDGRAFH